MSFAHGKIQPPVPRHGQYVARPALETRLRQALASQRAVLVCAPAGYGKTALLVRALAGRRDGHGLAWVSLDPGDDLARLLECLLAALDAFDPPWRVAPEGLLAAALRGDARGRQEAVDGIVNALDACELVHGTIVLDDLHCLDDEAGWHFLSRLLERLGSRWTLALATREEPSTLLARAAAAGELAAFRQGDLQFTPDEVLAWFGPLGLDAEAALALHSRTAGWAAGLRLALSGAGGSGPGAAIDRAAFDFLATEVLSRLDPGLRTFLLDTSVLHELDAARCAALSDDERTPRWLDEIERRGLFASVVDEASGTLRLHDLFRDALQHRLRVERPADWTRQLQRAAAVETDPLRRQGLLLAAGRPDKAARALLASAPMLNTGGAAPSVLRMLAAFAPAFAATSAEWQRVAGLTKQTVWRLQEAERHFAAAEALYRERGDAAPAQTMSVRRAMALVALGRIGEAASLLEAQRGEPCIEAEARMIFATATMWLYLERGENDAVAPVFEDLVQQLQHTSELSDWGTVPPPRQIVCRGMAAPALRWARSALTVAGDRPVPLRTYAHLVLGWRAFWLGRPGEAQHCLDRALGDASWGGHEVIARSHALALQAALAVLRGDAVQALQAVRQRIDEQPAGYAGWGVWHVLYYGTRIAGAVGDAAMLRTWLQRLEALHDTLPDLTPQRLQPIAGPRGMLAMLEGDTATARRHWQELLAHETTADLLGQAGEVHVRLARLNLDRGDRDGAATLLAPLLEAADDGPRGAVLAADALAALAREDWSGRLSDAAAATLRAWADALAHPAAANATPPAAGIDVDDATAAAGPVLSPTGERLSARELEVLALIARGQSNKLIARALALSPHTVKRHVANALAKLGLASRGQAAAWYHGLPAAQRA